ncbi:reactive oxygen species modulator 1 [Adelges cooleyi]|uniref:reactive oxygen species modulator 1 n=1 Tax=Adelges cooleyi TaxID=133065 RepID=UPI00218036C0|nr:reactive oxygen species modulator 1 [Adelges cooleyi]
MVVVGGGYGQRQNISCFDKISNAFMMGATIGITMGIVFGGVSGLRYGLRGRELIGKTAITMLQSGGTFGTFMSVGAALRC